MLFSVCWMFFFWGMASSMIFTLLPIFIIQDLNGSFKSFGLLEGYVIFFSFMAKLFAGFIIDIFKRKIPMLFTGTIVTILSKIALACSFNVLFACIAKSIDRFAKGIRQVPCDAIIAEASNKIGFAFSFKYMMNMAGSLIGSIFSSVLIMLFNNMRIVFILSIIPTLIAFYILKTKIKYNDKLLIEQKNKHKWNIKNISQMPREYWKFMLLVAVLMFNRFSEGFITLKATETLPSNISEIPIFMAIYELCFFITAIPTAKLSDKFSKNKILFLGMFLILIADIFAIIAHSRPLIILVYIFAGMHMGVTQGTISAIVAEMAPKHLIGTAFAIFYGIEGITLFASNYLAGISPNISEIFGISPASGPFIIGAISTLIVMYYMRKKFTR